jgi:glycosyltransferase involved in cell wall biosynthesis
MPREPMPEASVVIPTRDEEGSIGTVLDEVQKALGNRLLEIIVVDTNSRDRTRDIARAKGARVVDEPRRGYGRAYKTGFAVARGRFIATLDADLTYPANRLPDFLDALESEQADIVSGERISRLRPEAMSGMHRIGNEMLNLTFRFLYGASVRDSQSGMWAFRRDILSRLRLVHDGMAFSEELKIEAIVKGFRFLEIPIDYRVRVGDKKIRSMRDALVNFVWMGRKRFGWARARGPE